MLGIRIRNHKSFTDRANPQGFDELTKINVVIGKNNVGKSALVDVFEILDRIENDNGKLIFEELFTREHRAHSSFRSQISYDRNDTNEERLITQHIQNHFFNTKFSWYIENRAGKLFNDSQIQDHKSRFQGVISLKDTLVKCLKESLPHYKLFRLSADRDIKPTEVDSIIQTTLYNINPNGDGIAQVIYQILNREEFDRKLIIKKMLFRFNEILGRENYRISDIVIRQKDRSLWDVYLEEDVTGNLVNLTNSGSGIKTIIFVLLYTEVLLADTMHGMKSEVHPDGSGGFSIENVLEDKEIPVLGFEELENNLHPSLLRRLLEYLREYVSSPSFNGHLVLTTHSHIVIDFFANNRDAQILYVTKEGLHSRVKTIKNFSDHKAILDELDYRASDLLQANGIIWVEGPSDRLYIRSWIDLVSDVPLIEGFHYQCVPYGGALAYYLDAKADYPEANENDVTAEVNKFVDLLKVSTNMIFVMDSDSNLEPEALKAQKNRIKTAVEGSGGYCWITKGVDIENYIPFDIIKQAYGAKVVREGFSWDTEFEFLFAQVDSEHKPYRQKIKFCLDILREKLSKQDYLSVSETDWGTQMDEIVRRIKQWNGIETPAKGTTPAEA